MATRAIAQPVRVLADGRARDTHSLTAQSALLRQYVSDRGGWVLMIELSDGSSRQGLRRAPEEARAGTYDVLLVHSLSRLSRSFLEMSRILGHLESSGVAVRSVTEQFDVAGPTDHLVVQVLAATAGYENRRRRALTAYEQTRRDRCL